MREELPLDIGEALEFQRIAGGVLQEEGALFPGRARKAAVRRNDEIDALLLQTLRQRVLLRQGQHDAEMGYWYRIALHGGVRSRPARSLRGMVDHQLVAKEIEVHPVRRAASFGAAHQRAVEGTSGGEVIDRKREVKRAGHGADCQRAMPRERAALARPSARP